MIKLTKYIHVFSFHYLVMVIFLLTYLENTFFQIKNMSNTMCNALSIHVVDMHSCTGISLQWNLWEHLLEEYFAYSI